MQILVQIFMKNSFAPVTEPSSSLNYSFHIIASLIYKKLYKYIYRLKQRSYSMEDKLVRGQDKFNNIYVIILRTQRPLNLG